MPIIATLCLAVNDHLLKGAGILPGAVTGKLSDFAGLVMFPVLATAVIDSFWYAAHRAVGLGGNFSLSRRKLAASVVVTAGVFAAIKLSATAAAAADATLSATGLRSHTVADPTDLVALPCLWLAWRIGCREIAGVPLGRLAALEARFGRGDPAASEADVRAQLDDVAQCGAHPVEVGQLASGLVCYYATGDAAPAQAALNALRSRQ